MQTDFKSNDGLYALLVALFKSSTGDLLGYSEFEFRGYVLFAFTLCMF